MVSLDSLNPFKAFRKTVNIQPSETNEYVELEIEKETEPTPKLYMKVFSVSKYEDADLIIDEIRGGSSIIIIRANDLRNRDEQELTRFLAKIKKTADAVGAQIVGVDENLFIIAPSFVKIEKGNPPPNIPESTTLQ